MATSSVTKKELLNSVHVLAGEAGVEISKTDLEAVLGAYHETLMGSVIYGNRVQLGKLGSLTPAIQNARMARNPKTGEQIEVPEKVTVKFALGKSFKDLLNDDESPAGDALRGE